MSDIADIKANVDAHPCKPPTYFNVSVVHDAI
jgi:hypothetical protein